MINYHRGVQTVRCLSVCLSLRIAICDCPQAFVHYSHPAVVCAAEAHATAAARKRSAVRRVAGMAMHVAGAGGLASGRLTLQRRSSPLLSCTIQKLSTRQHVNPRCAAVAGLAPYSVRLYGVRLIVRDEKSVPAFVTQCYLTVQGVAAPGFCTAAASGAAAQRQQRRAGARFGQRRPQRPGEPGQGRRRRAGQGAGAVSHGPEHHQRRWRGAVPCPARSSSHVPFPAAETCETRWAFSKWGVCIERCSC